MKTLSLVLAFAAVAAAQRHLKGGKHKPAYIATSPGALPEAAPQQSHYQSAAPQSHHHGGSGFSSGIGKSATKPNYPLLLSDTRTLNSDGSINFNYQADNGLQQGETVDSDGTRRGFYSYPGNDGKTITVKYTAGKGGYVAEGDHLPLQPHSAPHNPKQESQDLYSGKKGSFGFSGGDYSQSQPSYHGGNRHQGGHRGHQSANIYSHNSGHGGGASFANFPDFSSQFQSSGHNAGTPSYSAGAGRYPGLGSYKGHSSGSPGTSSYSSLQSLGKGSQGGANFADFNNLAGQLGASYNGPMFTANNPYQAGGTGPVNAGFDLGNGGHFSINFQSTPSQEYNPSEAEYPGAGHHQGSGFTGAQG